MSDLVDLMLEGGICMGCGDILWEEQGFPGYCPTCVEQLDPKEKALWDWQSDDPQLLSDEEKD